MDADPTATLTSLQLRTEDACVLDADLAEPAGRSPIGVAILLHPHPLYGGDRHNPVIDALFAALPSAGIAALRFDFRGVGASTGSHGKGVTERLDVSAAIHTCTDHFPNLPVWVVGYSFGSMVGLATADPAIAGWVAIAPPFALATPEVHIAGHALEPKLLIMPGHDQFTTVDNAKEQTQQWRSTSLEVLPAADHFLAGHTRRVAELAVRFMQDHLRAGD